MCSPQSNGFFIASSVNTWTLLQTASRVLELAHSLKAAWMVVASNPSTEPDRPSPGLLTICKYRLMLCSGQRCTETLTVCPASELWNLFLFSLFILVQPSTVCKFNTFSFKHFDVLSHRNKGPLSSFEVSIKCLLIQVLWMVKTNSKSICDVSWFWIWLTSANYSFTVDENLTWLRDKFNV